MQQNATTCMFLFNLYNFRKFKLTAWTPSSSTYTTRKVSWEGCGGTVALVAATASSAAARHNWWWKLSNWGRKPLGLGCISDPLEEGRRMYQECSFCSCRSNRVVNVWRQCTGCLVILKYIEKLFNLKWTNRDNARLCLVCLGNCWPRLRILSGGETHTCRPSPLLRDVWVSL